MSEQRTLAEALKIISEKLEAGEYDEDFRKMAEEIKAKIQSDLAFYRTPEFNSILGRFADSDIETIDNESLLYHPAKYPITGEEFHKLFDSIWETHWNRQAEDEESMFEAYKVDWEGYTLTMMHGQGTLLSIAKNKE